MHNWKGSGAYQILLNNIRTIRRYTEYKQVILSALIFSGTVHHKTSQAAQLQVAINSLNLRNLQPA